MNKKIRSNFNVIVSQKLFRNNFLRIVLLLLLLAFGNVGLGQITIGTGTSTQRYPLGNYFGYERSASIYTSAEIGTAGTISKLAFYATIARSTSIPIKIYIKHTSSSTLTADTWANLISSATTVYNSTNTSITANAWNEFNLSPTFSYNGTDNLLVLVETNYGGSGDGNGSSGTGVRYTSATSKHEYFYADTNPPTTSGTVSNSRPNIQITISSSCSSPSSAAASAITSSGATANWSGGTGSYIVEYGASGFTPGTGASAGTGGTVINVSAGNYSTAITGLSSGTAYSYYVRQVCSGPTYSANSSVQNFITLCSNKTLTYSQGFNASSIPACWSQQYVTGTLSFTYPTTGTGTPAPAPQEGTNQVMFNSYSNSGSQTRLVSPPITTTGASSVDAEFQWYFSTNGGSSSYLTEGVQVQYSTDGTAWTNAGSLIRRYGATDGWALQTVTLPAGAGNQATVYVGFLFTSNAGYDSYLDAVSIKTTPGAASIALSDNGTQVAAANVNQGTTNLVLHKFKLDVTTANATLTGMTCTTGGTYVSADIANLKVWYQTTSTFNSGTATLLSTLTTPGIAGSKTFSSFTSQLISSGSTGYVYITADIAASAIHNNTISFIAIAVGNLTFSSGTKTGSTTGGGSQTFKDVTAPTVSAYSPTDGNTAVTVNQNLVLTFSENVQAGTAGNIVIYNSGGTVFETIAYNDGRITFSTNTVTINPTGTFAEGAGYYVQISNTVITDIPGNAYAGISDATTWNFTTVGPTVTNVSSATANGTYKTSDVITITVTFSSAVTVTGTPRIQLETGTTDEYVNYSSGSGSTVLTFSYTVQAGDVSADLDYLATTALTLNGGTINSAGGVAATLTLPTVGGASSIAGQKAIVIDGVTPTVSTYSPTDGNTAVTVNQNLVLTFSENVQAGTAGNIVIYNSGGTVFETIPYNDPRITYSSSTVTIDPTGTFTSSSDYYVQILATAITDIAGNPYAGISNATTWNFTTVCSGLSGTVSAGSGQTYTSLTGSGGLFAAINSCGLSGNLTVNITSDITAETGENSLNQWAGAYTVAIQPDGTTLRTISGTVGAVYNAMIIINGADGLTIDGGSGKYLRFRNTNSSAASTRSTFLFINGSTSCSLTNCDIENNETSSTYANVLIGSGTNFVTISNNNIHEATGGTAGYPYNGIYSSTSTNTITVSGNNIYNWTNYGICFSSLADGAIISNNSLYSTVTNATSSIYGIYVTAGKSHTISGNYIGGQSANCGGSAWVNSSSSCWFYGINLSVGTAAATSVQGNTIQNISLTGTTSPLFYGIYASSGLVNFGTITGNTIGHPSAANSISVAGSNSTYGIYITSTTSTSNVENNIIANISSNGTYSPNLYGIYIYGGNIRKNKIYNLGSSSSGNTPSIYGIYNYGVSGATNEHSNNFIALSGGSAASAFIAGYYDNAYSSATYNIIYNTINITGTASSGSLNSMGYYRNIAAIDVFKNNIVSNTRSGGTGKHYAMYAYASGTWTCDYNDLYTSASATLGYWSSTDKDFTNWKTAEGSQDSHSNNTLPSFTSSTNLHIATTVGDAVTGTGITTDIDGETRSLTIPCIGADEIIPCTATITLAANNVSSSSQCAGTTKVPIQSFSLTPTDCNGNLTNVGFTTSGSYVQADISKYQLWYRATTNDISGATQLGVDLSSSGAAGARSFSAFSSPILTVGTTYYFWITTNFAAGAVNNNAITVNEITTSNLTSTSTKTGSSSAAGDQTIIGGLSSVSVIPTQSQNICIVESGTQLQATESGGGLIVSHQWGKRSISGGAITNISGAINGTYTPTGADLGTGTWYVVCTSTTTCGSAKVSNEITIVVLANLSAVNISPTGAQSMCTSGSGSLLTAAETGGGTIISRQWGKRSISGGTITDIIGATSSTYTPSGIDLGAGIWYIVCTSTPTCGSASISNQITVTVNSAPSGGIISGTSTVLSGASGITYTYSGGSPVASSWSWTVPTGASITSGSGTATITVTFGSSSGNVTCTPTYSSCVGAAINFPVTVSTGNAGVVNNGATIYINSGGTFYIDGDANGSFSNFQNGSNYGKILNYGTIALEGNWYNYVNNGTFHNGTTAVDAGTVQLNGAAQSISGTYVTKFFNLTLAGSAGSTKTLGISTQVGGNTTLTGILAFGDHPLNLGGFTLVISNSAITAYTRSSGYIISNSLDKNFNSKVQWNFGSITGDHIYPFGVDASNYIPFTFKLAAGGNCGGSVTVSTYPTGGTTATDIYSNKPTIVNNLGGVYSGQAAPGNAENIVKRFWLIEPTSNPITGAADITFKYPSTEYPISGNDAGNMSAQRYNSGSNLWELPVLGGDGSGSPSTVTVTNQSGFSPWAIVKKTKPLPVELLSFDAFCKNDIVNIIWQTASETNNDFFTVERTKDMQTWEQISVINGAGNSNSPLNYSAIDLYPYSGESYYRLLQTDFDGVLTYFTEKHVECSNNNVLQDNNFEITSVGYNYSNNELELVFNTPIAGNLEICLFNSIGQQITRRISNSVNGVNSIKLSDIYLCTGVYLFSLRNNEELLTKKIVVHY
jgi:hypothetical protein